MRATAVFLAGIFFCGCERAPSPTVNLHDSKFAAVETAVTASGDCTLDKFTGLTWEVKSDEPGLHDWRNTYS